MRKLHELIAGYCQQLQKLMTQRSKIRLNNVFKKTLKSVYSFSSFKIGFQSLCQINSTACFSWHLDIHGWSVNQKAGQGISIIFGEPLWPSLAADLCGEYCQLLRWIQLQHDWNILWFFWITGTTITTSIQLLIRRIPWLVCPLASCSASPPGGPQPSPDININYENDNINPQTKSQICNKNVVDCFSM